MRASALHSCTSGLPVSRSLDVWATCSSARGASGSACGRIRACNLDRTHFPHGAGRRAGALFRPSRSCHAHRQGAGSNRTSWLFRAATSERRARAKSLPSGRPEFWSGGLEHGHFAARASLNWAEIRPSRQSPIREPIAACALPEPGKLWVGLSDRADALAYRARSSVVQQMAWRNAWPGGGSGRVALGSKVKRALAPLRAASSRSNLQHRRRLCEPLAARAAESPTRSRSRARWARRPRARSIRCVGGRVPA